MAIDSTLYAVDMPAGTYAAGDILPMACVSGPANVRSGRGTAILKRLTSGVTNYAGVTLKIHVKNSDWVDEMVNFSGRLDGDSALDVHSGLVQFGNNDPLTENSGWSVYAEVVIGGTSSAAASAFAIIDVDYPSVSAIADPDKLVGVPVSISLDMSVTTTAYGGLSTANWTVTNVDYFKAGNQYCIQEIGVVPSNATGTVGFVALANAAGMGGLCRIIPFNTSTQAIRNTVEYATKLVKGPMDVKIIAMQSTATTATMHMVHDYVKRSA